MVTANQPRTAKSIANGEYLIRLLDGSASQSNRSMVAPLMAEILEGYHHGRRLRINFAPVVMQGSASARRLERIAKPGACFLARVATRSDGAGCRKNIITRLCFLGDESGSTSEMVSLN